MNKHYQSDLEPEEPKDTDRAIELTFATLMVALFLLMICLASLAEQNQAGEPPCVPGVSDYDMRMQSTASDFALLWWCDDADGLHGYWWTDSVAKSSSQAVLKLASRDPDEFRYQLGKRWSTVDQIGLAMDTTAEQGPRCYAKDRPVSCVSWKLDGDKRLCDIGGQIQPDGTRSPANSWAQCELRKAPKDGW